MNVTILDQRSMAVRCVDGEGQVLYSFTKTNPRFPPQQPLAAGKPVCA